MRVLLHAGVDLSLPGGLETHVRQLATGLAARGHEVDICGLPEQLPPFRMVQRIDPARYDVLHHHGSTWPPGVDAGPRYVRSFHFCTRAKMERYLRIGRIRTLLNPGNWSAMAEERRSLQRGGRVIAVAPRLANELVRLYGADRSRISVIPNGATFSPPTEGRVALRERYGVAPGAPVLLTVGREDFVKGYDLLERVWTSVRRLVPDAVWVRVGGAAPSRGEGSVVTGSVPHDEVVSWIHAADVGATPSYYEGCGIVILEMLAGGLYVLSHDVGIAPEVIRAGENGAIVAQTRPAWVTALIDALKRRPRGQGLDPAYRWDRIVERIEALYREAEA